MARASKIFISYSWEGEEHSDQVLVLADTLEKKGMEVMFDQYDPFPEISWPRWMANAVETADFALCLCTRSYHERWKGQQPVGTGLGCQWEGTLITNLAASRPDKLTRFMPLLFKGNNLDDIPIELSGNNRFLVTELSINDPDFRRLYMLLSHQNTTPRPERGEIEILEPKPRITLPRSGSHQTLTLKDEGVDTTIKVQNQKVQRVAKSGGGDFLSRQVNQLTTVADRLEGTERFEEAAEMFLKAYSLDGSRVHLLTSAGLCQLAAENEQVALELANKALSARPSNVEAQALAIFIECENLKERIKLLEELYLANPENEALETYYLNALRFSEDRLGKLQEIAETGSRAAITQTGWALMDTGDYEGAISWWTKANAIKVSAIAWLNLGICFAFTKRIGLALEAFNSSLLLEKSYARAHWCKGCCYALMNQADRCVASLRKAVLIFPRIYEQYGSNEQLDSVRNEPVFQEFLVELKGLPGVSISD